MKLTRKLVLAKAKASDLESVKKLNCWYVYSTNSQVLWGLVIFIHVYHLYLYHMLFNRYNGAFYCYLMLITFSIDFSIVL